MSAPNEPQQSVPLMQTCQTCFHAKIRCDRTQDSDFCDRCLRLGKICVFGPARRRRKDKRLRQENGLKPVSGGRGVSKSPSHSPAYVGRPVEIFNADASVDPFERGILTAAAGEKLIQFFNSRMLPYFPFVVFPDMASITELNSERPCAFLAALAAASYADPYIQKALGTLFIQLVAARLAGGKFSSLDMLQGLLIHLAWAHYQPRPKKYTQHLLLATSIVSDMRLDKPRRPKLWSIDGGKDRDEPDWGPEEMRALAGMYYLSSSSSIILQKSRHFTYTPYISDCCEHLALLNMCATDRYLASITRLQRLTERLEDAVSISSASGDLMQLQSDIMGITQECAEVKMTLPFSLSASPPLLLQFHLLELLLSQSSPRGTPFGLDKLQTNLIPSEGHDSLMSWLSASMSAARSLISVVLVLPQGEEAAMSNIGWITVYCGLSLTVRLDLISAGGSLSRSTQHLRRFLDMPHTLRQIALRLEAAAGPGTNESSNGHQPFQDLAKRVRRLEEWYAARVNRQLQTAATTMAADAPPVSDAMLEQSALIESMNWYRDPSLDMNNFFVMNPFDFSPNFGL